jgi:hypothetical protein
MTPRQAAWKKEFEASFAESEIDLSFHDGLVGLIWLKEETAELWQIFCDCRTFGFCIKPIKAVSV